MIAAPSHAAQAAERHVSLPPVDAAHPRPHLPARLAGLLEIAGNLGWSWNREARALFRAIDERLWHVTRHNPLVFLREVDPARLVARAADRAFVAKYDHVMRWVHHERTDTDTWFATTYPDLRGRPIAYFSAEYGFHNSLPIYSGGLGVLAGDHCKTASDLGVPLVAIGILYRSGYFDQRVTLEGWQEDSDNKFDLADAPLAPVPGPDGAEHLVVVRMAGRDVHIRVWRLAMGRVPVYLLDSDLAVNHPEDRPLLSKLYAGGPGMRLHQEWLLGVGGVRALRALGIHPGMWHANEGHASFMLLERVRELTKSGVPFDDAVSQVRATSLFTTHTPVPAGHDIFDNAAVADTTGPLWEDLGVARERMLALAEHPDHDNRFHMTALAIRLSRHVNGVSERHGVVTRDLWRGLWPDRRAEGVPVGHVTNGVHLASWMANPIMQLLDKHCGRDWGLHVDDPTFWERVLDLPDDEMWAAHMGLKRVLFRNIREFARRAFTSQHLEAAQIVGAGSLLDVNTLTIGFARRFATYKRASLIFHDPERLRRIVTNPERPVQIIFAGKAHPADQPGKQVLQQVYHFTRDPKFEGRIAFLDDYEMHLAHLLVQGTDLWMNLPRVPMEASGTSGMKAALNGVPQMGTVDGWWEEGYDGTNGWAVAVRDGDDADAAAAERLYQLLETEVVPMFYARPDRSGPSPTWTRCMKHALRQAGRRFTGSRMLREYVANYYAPTLRGNGRPDDPPAG
jgi:glycogen phosphorylase